MPWTWHDLEWMFFLKKRVRCDSAVILIIYIHKVKRLLEVTTLRKSPSILRLVHEGGKAQLAKLTSSVVNLALYPLFSFSNIKQENNYYDLEALHLHSYE